MTPEQIDNCNEFHYGECSCIIGPRGGKTIKQERWRRSGKTQRWKRDPVKFRIPIKWGLKTSYAIEPDNASNFHAAEDCPLNK